MTTSFRECDPPIIFSCRGQDQASRGGGWVKYSSGDGAFKVMLGDGTGKVLRDTLTKLN